jgi:isocitrate dehydrogenase kinase/phosphatase
VTTSLQSRAAALVLDAFLDYNARFSDITRRAKRRFERRDWKYVRVDAAARIDLYEVCVRETLGRLELRGGTIARARSGLDTR